MLTYLIFFLICFRDIKPDNILLDEEGNIPYFLYLLRKHRTKADNKINICKIKSVVLALLYELKVQLLLSLDVDVGMGVGVGFTF